MPQNLQLTPEHLNHQPVGGVYEQPAPASARLDFVRGRLYPHVGDPGIYRCPSDRSTVTDRPDLRRFRSYSLNGELNYWIIADAEYGLPILQAFHNESQLRRPSATYGFLDVKSAMIDSGIFGILRAFNTQGRRSSMSRLELPFGAAKPCAELR